MEKLDAGYDKVPQHASIARRKQAAFVSCPSHNPIPTYSNIGASGTADHIMLLQLLAIEALGLGFGSWRWD